MQQWHLVCVLYEIQKCWRGALLLYCHISHEACSHLYRTSREKANTPKTNTLCVILFLKESVKEITLFLSSFLIARRIFLPESSCVLCCFCCCWVGMKSRITWAFLVPKLCTCVKAVENLKEFGALLRQKETSWSKYELFSFDSFSGACCFCPNCMCLSWWKVSDTLH